MATIDDCTEDYKWGVPVYDGGKFYIAAMKSRVHLGFATAGLTDDEIKTLEGTGKTMRHIKIHTMDDVADKHVEYFIKLVHERAAVSHSE